MSTFEACINPLVCIEIANIGASEPPPSSDRLLEFVFAPGIEATREAFTSRYRELATAGAALPIVPAEPNILDKLVWPLRGAIGSYSLGNYLACIAMCGLVGEMVAILIWDISHVEYQGCTLDIPRTTLLLGSKFEKLGQERRIQVLKASGLIDEPARIEFDRLRGIRRKYLHFFSQPHSGVAVDARNAFAAAAAVVTIALAVTFKDGKVLLRPELASYLAAKGHWRSGSTSNEGAI